MGALLLEIVGVVPEEVDLEPTRQVISALVQSDIVLPEGTINVAFVDDPQSRELNRQYSGNDYATDVLSFSYIEDGGEPIAGVIGELAVAWQTAIRQADEAGTTLAEEIALLVLHGVLHIGGYDHQTAEEQATMQTWQKKLMGAAGYAYREFKWENS